jgi:hypothetical protein
MFGSGLSGLGYDEALQSSFQMHLKFLNNNIIMIQYLTNSVYEIVQLTLLRTQHTKRDNFTSVQNRHPARRLNTCGLERLVGSPFKVGADPIRTAIQIPEPLFFGVYTWLLNKQFITTMSNLRDLCTTCFRFRPSEPIYS